MKNSLSVVGGKYRGAKLLSPQDAGTHPMGAREKNALFNRLSDRLAQARVLDAYAGTGALAAEAFSRGATVVDLVEKSSKVAKIAKQNILALGEQANIYTTSVGSFVEQFAGERYDIIIADPPYDQINVGELARLSALLVDDGVLVLSHPAKMVVPELNGLTLLSSKTYAGAAISFYGKYGKIEL